MEILFLHATLLVAALLTQAFFSGSEIALVSANRIRLRANAENGDLRAKRTLSLLDREERLLGTCLIGTNIAVVSGTTIATSLVSILFADPIYALFYIPIALVFGEAVPKTVFEHHADSIAPFLAIPVRAIQKFFAPFLFVLSGWTKIMSFFLGEAIEVALSRDDITALISDVDDSDIGQHEQRVIQGLLEIGQTPVEHCMTPLVEVYAVEDTATVAEVVSLSVKHGHTRIAIFHERVDQIIGITEVKRFLYAPPDCSVLDTMTKVPIVPESKPADDLLKEMRLSQSHFAIVVDEYGGTVGIVTIEDLLEEIFGEIEDERDHANALWQRLTTRLIRVKGRMEIDAMEDALPEILLPIGDYETVAGMLLSEFGSIPSEGTKIVVNNVQYGIEEATDRAIVSVLITLPIIPPST
jgi:CBS domain containing-hemolysin-like protein